MINEHSMNNPEMSLMSVIFVEVERNILKLTL